MVTDSGWDETRRGRNVMDLSIDRIDSKRGYEEGNVRVITIGENAARGDTDISWINHYGPYSKTFTDERDSSGEDSDNAGNYPDDEVTATDEPF